jgi:hypothetical protein
MAHLVAARRLGSWLFVGCVALSLLAGCRKHEKGGPEALGTIRGPLVAARPSAARRDLPRRYPGGPRLAILPGEGVGPIRFGATVATVERLMESKCDVSTERVCRYVNRAVEFELKDGVVVGMMVHRGERPAGTSAAGIPLTYGVFNGFVPPDPKHNRPLNVMFGMHVPGVKEGMGPPRKVEAAPAGNPNGTVELHYYDGAVLEYDQVPEAHVPVLGGVRILPVKP